MNNENEKQSSGSARETGRAIGNGRIEETIAGALSESSRAALGALAGVQRAINERDSVIDDVHEFLVNHYGGDAPDAPPIDREIAGLLHAIEELRTWHGVNTVRQAILPDGLKDQIQVCRLTTEGRRNVAQCHLVSPLHGSNCQLEVTFVADLSGHVWPSPVATAMPGALDYCLTREQQDDLALQIAQIRSAAREEVTK